MSVLVASPVQAQVTDTTTFNVLIEIIESCSISDITATDVDYGTHARNAATDVEAEGTLHVNCTLDTAYNIGLNEGLYASSIPASATNRQMASGTDRVPYGLYRDAAHTLFWGDEIGTNTLAGTGTGVSEDIPVYGLAPSTDYPPGSYSDTVTATITY